MRAVIQRTQSASVSVDQKITGSINQGLLVFLGIEDSDQLEDVKWLAAKIANMRIFKDEKQAMNLSLIDIKGQILVVSQFTLFASTKKGNRPSFMRSGKPTFANEMYEAFKKEIQTHLTTEVQSGIFAADMQVNLLNDGPVTIIIDTKNKE